MSARDRVLVSPAIGGQWLGEVVGIESLEEGVAGAVEVPPGYALVRCTDFLNAPRLVVGHVYLVLSRFVSG
jgi:hypothetical protein